MQIFSKELGSVATNVFLVWDDQTKEALIIDSPERSFDAVQSVVDEHKLTIKALLLTHGHWDHIADAPLFQKKNIPVYAHKGDTLFYENPMVMSMTMPYCMNLEPVRVDHWVEDGTLINLLGQSIEVCHVPGHAPGNVLFYFNENKAAFVGDVLFSGSIGRYDFPGCSFEVLEKSIKDKIYTLPHDTIVYPGHGPNTTVGYESKHNPYVTL